MFFLRFFLFVKIYALSAFGQVHDPYVWSQVRHVGVVWFVFMFSNFSRLDFSQQKRNLCRMSKFAMKHQQGLD